MTLKTPNNGFNNFKSTARELGNRIDLSPLELRHLLCRDCDFFTEDHDEDLECACFKLLRLIIKRGAMTPLQLEALIDQGEENG